MLLSQPIRRRSNKPIQVEPQRRRGPLPSHLRPLPNSLLRRRNNPLQPHRLRLRRPLRPHHLHPRTHRRRLPRLPRRTRLLTHKRSIHPTIGQKPPRTATGRIAELSRARFKHPRLGSLELPTLAASARLCRRPTTDASSPSSAPVDGRISDASVASPLTR